MTYAEREEIFSKDYLDIEDVGKLLGLVYNDAAKLIREIKRGLEFQGKKLRIEKQGKLHVQDYLDYYNLTSERYGGILLREILPYGQNDRGEYKDGIAAVATLPCNDGVRREAENDSD